MSESASPEPDAGAASRVHNPGSEADVMNRAVAQVERDLEEQLGGRDLLAYHVYAIVPAVIDETAMFGPLDHFLVRDGQLPKNGKPFVAVYVRSPREKWQPHWFTSDTVGDGDSEIADVSVVWFSLEDRGRGVMYGLDSASHTPFELLRACADAVRDYESTWLSNPSVTMYHVAHASDDMKSELKRRGCDTRTYVAVYVEHPGVIWGCTEKLPAFIEGSGNTKYAVRTYAHVDLVYVTGRGSRVDNQGVISPGSRVNMWMKSGVGTDQRFEPAIMTVGCIARRSDKEVYGIVTAAHGLVQLMMLPHVSPTQYEQSVEGLRRACVSTNTMVPGMDGERCRESFTASIEIEHERYSRGVDIGRCDVETSICFHGWTSRDKRNARAAKDGKRALVDAAFVQLDIRSLRRNGVKLSPHPRVGIDDHVNKCVKEAEAYFGSTIQQPDWSLVFRQSPRITERMHHCAYLVNQELPRTNADASTSGRRVSAFKNGCGTGVTFGEIAGVALCSVSHTRGVAIKYGVRLYDPERGLLMNEAVVSACIQNRARSVRLGVVSHHSVSQYRHVRSFAGPGDSGSLVCCWVRPERRTAQDQDEDQDQVQDQERIHMTPTGLVCRARSRPVVGNDHTMFCDINDVCDALGVEIVTELPDSLADLRCDDEA